MPWNNRWCNFIHRSDQNDAHNGKQNFSQTCVKACLRDHFCSNGLHHCQFQSFNKDSSGAQVTLPSSACMKQSNMEITLWWHDIRTEIHYIARGKLKGSVHPNLKKNHFLTYLSICFWWYNPHNMLSVLQVVHTEVCIIQTYCKEMFLLNVFMLMSIFLSPLLF